ncbi:ABC transporter ATP-binding protein [Alphaproteobacteria bacterium LSUCC0684]
MPLLSAENITKKFGHFAANDEVSFAIEPGSIHALLGENGAGKSTFVKMLYGVLQPDEGRFFWQGRPLRITSPKMARALGIAMVFQHFSLFPALTVAENIALAMDDADTLSALRHRIREASDHWGLAINPDRPVGELSVGEQQRVEILRCLLQDPKLLIMDEPTSVLTPQESLRLFDVLRRLAADGCAILYISHKLDEIMELTEKATILRGGRNVGEVIPRQSSTRDMAEIMVGDAVDWIERRKTHDSDTSKPPLFELIGLNRPAASAFATPLRDIHLSVRPGEILGIAGISGNGQEELAEALSGEWLSPDPAMIRLDGENIGHTGPERRRQMGLETVPEERNGHAAVPDMTMVENTFLTQYFRFSTGTSWLRRQLAHPGLGQDATEMIIRTADVRTPRSNPRANQLSGGNLQKFIMGRMLSTRPLVAVISQPTWGVDVGAATAIRRALLQLAETGCAIILISQDLEEIFGLATRIAALNNGRLTEGYPAADLTAEDIGLMMGGAASEEEARA